MKESTLFSFGTSYLLLAISGYTSWTKRLKSVCHWCLSWFSTSSSMLFSFEVAIWTPSRDIHHHKERLNLEESKGIPTQANDESYLNIGGEIIREKTIKASSRTFMWTHQAILNRFLKRFLADVMDNWPKFTTHVRFRVLKILGFGVEFLISLH